MKEFSKSIFLLFITLALCFSLLEGILHLLIKENYDVWILSKSLDKAPDPVCRLPPNTTIVNERYIKQKKVTEIIPINSQCIRDYEYSLAKPKDTYCIIGIGDSFTFGSSVKLEDSYLKQLEKMLNSDDKKIRYEVINIGVPGYNLENKLEILTKKGLAYNPNLVIIQLYSDDWMTVFPARHIIYQSENNSDFKVFEVVQSIDKKFKGKIKLINLLDHYLEKRLTEKAFKELIPPPEKAIEKTNRILNNLSTLSNKTNISYLFITIGVDKNIRELIKEQNFSIIDVDEILASYKISEITIDYPQDPHFNPLGNKVIAKAIYQSLKSDLNE